ncbi:MAG: helix-turn-helix domain-containing protein [Eudoraea sp.]|nr:helix-turn-helix domain-containing protein [Eudoraea sp.]NNJ41319.1 helix-turn-helix domain-containing protein [Eudoraea sp.]
MGANTINDPAIIQKLRAILDANLGNEGFGVKELAREAGLSRSSLHRKVHAYNGNSTSQFIREYRLQNALKMLQEGEETVSEIAYNVGFSSPTYFNTCFKEYYGYPPGEAKIRADSAEQETDQTLNPYPLVRTKDRITYLNRRLKRTKRWMAVLAIGIVVTIAWAASYYINTSEDTAVTNSVELSEIKSIAVLPFINLSGDPDLEYRSEGMTEAVITRLGFIENLKVIPFTSVRKYKSSDNDAPSIAKELGVQYIFQGSFQLSGDGDLVKFTLHLINGPSNTNVSSEDYIGAWNEDIFSMQTAVVEDLISQLNIEIDNKELLAIERVPTENREAYNTWLQGKYQAFKYTKNGMENAILLYEEAIRLDPNFVEPYVDLAQLYLLAGASWGIYTESEAWIMAKELLLKAIEVDDTYQEAKEVLNDGLYLYEWDFETMEKNYQTASNLKITYCLQTGRYEEALALNEQLHIEYPNSVFLITSKALTLSSLNKSEEAFKILKSSDKLYSDHIMYLRIASRAYFYMKEYESAYNHLNKFIQTFPERPPTVLWILAACEYQKGNLEAAKKYIAEIENKYEEGASGSPAWFLALYYASIGDYEQAFEWLQNSYDRHEVEMIWLREEPPLKPLRSDPRYVELYHKVGFPMPPHPN